MTKVTKSIPIGLANAVLNSSHGGDLSSGEGTHESALRFIGQLVQYTPDEDLLLEIVKARLPEGYSGNTLEEIPGMITSAIAKGFDQATPKGDGGNPKQSTEALAHIQSSGMTLLHDKLGKTYATFDDHVNGSIVIPIESSEMKRRIQHLYFKSTGRAIAQAALTEVTDTLNAQASFAGETEEIHLRIGGHEHDAYIDRGAEKDSFIKLANGEWPVVDAAPIKLRRSAGFEELPIPTRGGDPTIMQELLGLDDDNFVLFIAFLLMCLNPRGPYMLLLVQSGQGSGKSYLCSAIKMMIDPSVVVKQRIPGSERDLAIQAKDHRLLSYDNASALKSDMSDSFCTLATGGAFTTRKLYKDDESQIFQHVRPVIMNGIGDYAYRPDLLERSIMLKLSPIPKNGRRTEREMDARLEELMG